MRGSVGRPLMPYISEAFGVPSAAGSLPPWVEPQPKRNSRSDEPVRAHVKPVANCLFEA